MIKNFDKVANDLNELVAKGWIIEEAKIDERGVYVKIAKKLSD